MATIAPGLDIAAFVLEPTPEKVVWAEKAGQRLAEQRTKRSAALNSRRDAMRASSSMYEALLLEHDFDKPYLRIRREWFHSGRSEGEARRSARDPNPARSVAAVGDHPGKLARAIRKDVALRPPLTQLVHRPGGTAIPLYLNAVAAAQIMGRPGRKVRFEQRGFANVRHPDAKWLWSDLIAEADGTWEHKRRRVNAGLQRLHTLKLVGQVVDHRWSTWRLRRENGTQLYRVPTNTDGPFLRIPLGFWANGWANVLTPGEIAVYFMLRHAILDFGRNGVGLVDWKRKGYYGISNEVYTATHELEEFGLIERSPSAHTRRAGRVTHERLAQHQSGALPLSVEHFSLRDEGLREPAVEVVLQKLASSSLPPRWDVYRG